MNCQSREMLNFDFLEKGLGIVSSPPFGYDFSRKMFPMLYSNNWPNSIAWLLLLHEIMDSMCIGIVCCPGCYVIIFEINLIFLIKSFFHLTKNQGKNLIILRTKRAFKVKYKAFFIIFQGFSIAKNFIKP